jgi:hypothetical protein
MKKKKLLKKIYQLEEINESLGLQNIRLRMKLAGTCTQEEAKGTILERTSEPESKEQNDKRREGIRLNRYCHINDALDAMTGGIWSPETKKEEKAEPVNEAVLSEETKNYVKKMIYSTHPEIKTEGAESESELKENTISLEVGKKYMTKNGYKLICKEIDVHSQPSHEYIMTFEDSSGHMYYSKSGIVCNGVESWNIASEVKERKTIGQLEAERRQAYDHPF